MTRLVLIVLSIILATSYSTAESTCGINETLDNCPTDCPADHCPINEDQDRSACKRPMICPQPKCKCGFNYRYDRNGVCIPVKDCPPFPCPNEHEEYVYCPPYCPTDDCTQATPDGSCPLFGSILIVLRCRPTCRCIKGYWRLNGTCVPYSQCPKNT